MILNTADITPSRARSPLFPDSIPPSHLSWVALGWQASAYTIALWLGARYFSWPALIFAGLMHVLLGGGITLGAHRYFSHATFKAPLWFENYLAFIYTMSLDRCGQGIISWVAAHKFHHAHSDQPLDPHSPTEGFWHAFCGHHLWRREDLFNYETYKQLCPELTSRPWLVWFNKPATIWSIQICLGLIVWLMGGLLFGTVKPFDIWMANSFLVWGIFVRWSFTQTLHGLVDTVNHGFGSFHKLPDTYGTRNLSKNNLILWLPQLGNETWHNTHHAFPHAANNGVKWLRWDADSVFILCLERLGIVSGCRWLSEEDLERRQHHTASKAGQSHGHQDVS